MKQEREAGRRSITSASMPQYLSAVRQMQMASLGYAVSSLPIISAAIRGYKKLEEENYHKSETRIGIFAVAIQKIWELCMSNYSPSQLRDSAACVFDFCMKLQSVVAASTLESDYISQVLAVKEAL